MKYNDGDFCVCGHSYRSHWIDYATWCMACPTKCKEFKLDNLKYVEDEAKRRGLV
jgi:hypothetical protein